MKFIENSETDLQFMGKYNMQRNIYKSIKSNKNLPRVKTYNS